MEKLICHKGGAGWSPLKPVDGGTRSTLRVPACHFWRFVVESLQEPLLKRTQELLSFVVALGFPDCLMRKFGDVEGVH